MPSTPPTLLEVAREYCDEAMGLVTAYGRELQINDAWTQLGAQATFRGQGMDAAATQRLLGPADHLPAVAASAGIELDGFSVPGMDDMLTEAYASVRGGSWVGPIYGILSQFIHATPIAQMHLKRDTWPSLSAPMAAVALDAAAHGFTFLSYTILPVTGVGHAMAQQEFQRLFGQTERLHREAVAYHVIG